MKVGDVVNQENKGGACSFLWSRHMSGWVTSLISMRAGTHEKKVQARKSGRIITIKDLKVGKVFHCISGALMLRYASSFI